MSDSGKKKRTKTLKTFSPKNVSLRNFWKFHVVVVENNGKEMYEKKCAARAKFLFSKLIRPIAVFLPFSLPSPLGII